MSFLYPHFLSYMLPLLGIFFFFILTQRDKRESYFAPEVMERLAVHNKRLSVRARNVLYLLASICIVFALAQPVIQHGKVHVEQKSADIMIGLDISNSMLAEDVQPSRLQMAKHKILEFLKLLPQDRVGVIAFAGESYLVSPLSFDHRAVEFLVKHLATNSITQQGTNFGQLLYSANQSIKNKKERYLIIFTDGGDQKDFTDEISYAKKHHITVFIMAIGTQKGAPIKTANGFLTSGGNVVIARLNPNSASLATQTGGAYIHSVLSNADVKALVHTVEATVHQKVLRSKTVANNTPLFYYPLGAALFLLLFAMSSLRSRKSVIMPLLVIFPFFGSMPLHAGILDFATLHEANKAYKEHDYAKSSRYFSEYEGTNHTDAARYDLGNALYKDTKYHQAVHQYKRVNFTDKKQEAHLLYNLGNAYAKQMDRKSLEKALQNYKKSLALHEDADTRYNMQVVEKLLQQKKQKQKNEKKSEKKKKKKQSSTQNGSQKNNTQTQKNKSVENKHSQGAKTQKNQPAHTTQTKRQEQNSPQQMPQNAEKKNSMKNTQNIQAKKQQTVSSSSQAKERTMSAQDVQSWLKQINVDTPTHLYRLKQTNSHMEDYHAKPW
jgi:Ca-activated chloride channel homolog